jgi:hypothetical protein
MIQDNIYTFLSGTAALTALVPADQIGWSDVLNTEAYPKITYTCVSNPQAYPEADQWQRWRFYVVAIDKFEARAIADVLDTTLNRAYGDVGGVTVEFMAKIDESPVELRDDGNYELSLDYRIIYH